MREALAAGPMLSSELTERAEEADIKETTLRRAIRARTTSSAATSAARARAMGPVLAASGHVGNGSRPQDSLVSSFRVA